MARCLYILYIPVTHLRRTTTIDYPQQAKPKPNPSLLSTVLYLARSEKAAQLQDDRPGARTSMEHILV